jgi:hypothetical protein
MAGDIRADMAGSGTDKQTSANYRKGGQHKGGQHIGFEIKILVLIGSYF